MSDLAGNDIGHAVRTSLGLTDAAARDPAVEYSADVADALVEAGRLGQKAGKGWYLYEQPRVRLVRISTSRASSAVTFYFPTGTVPRPGRRRPDPSLRGRGPRAKRRRRGDPRPRAPGARE